LQTTERCGEVVDMLDLLIEISPTISTGYNGNCGTSTTTAAFRRDGPRWRQSIWGDLMRSLELFGN
jgi:hypothetical protein